VSKLIKSLGCAKVWVKFSVLMYPSVRLEIKAFCHIYLGGNCPPDPTHSSPAEAISPIPVKSPLSKRQKWHSTEDL